MDPKKKTGSAEAPPVRLRLLHVFAP